ncbi:t-SNARE domain-containing protein 1-like isoform X2 [Amphiprion ocellaris]|uniref:t-SNARE domain-containing protein 1-like isoform X2 n=1 Tax=Amphiprion ocellaris TaxID=80972 RepID=UPI0024116D20|nr:t-SNARE domain-containing protein 1-like isoform X2 [Amphiprion ocellaris]
MYVHINKLLIHGILRSVMAEKRKGNFSETKTEVLVDEVEARKSILFGGHSSGITNKRKGTEWQHVVTSVNSVGSTERTMAEVKKKWSDLKVEAKKRVTCHHQSMSATGGGRGKPEPTPLDSRIASILGTASGCGIVSEKEGDTDLAEPTEETELETLADEEVLTTACPVSVDEAWLSPVQVHPETMAHPEVVGS